MGSEMCIRDRGCGSRCSQASGRRRVAGCDGSLRQGRTLSAVLETAPESKDIDFLAVLSLLYMVTVAAQWVSPSEHDWAATVAG